MSVSPALNQTVVQRMPHKFNAKGHAAMAVKTPVLFWKFAQIDTSSLRGLAFRRAELAIKR